MIGTVVLTALVTILGMSVFHLIREQNCYSEGFIDGQKKAQLQQRFADGLSNNGQATILINMNDKIH